MIKTSFSAPIPSFFIAPVSETLSVVFAMLGKAGATMAFSDIYIFTSEIVPTEVRNTGMGTSSFCARISGMAAPYVGGLLVILFYPSRITFLQAVKF